MQVNQVSDGYDENQYRKDHIAEENESTLSMAMRVVLLSTGPAEIVITLYAVHVTASHILLDPHRAIRA